jgi:tRNA (cytidine/uridine-2'-O-)-methyltransferase
MLHVILFEPEIPANAGNVIRLCANTGAALHLVRPLGFSLSDARLRRAGLDYRDLACVQEHADLDACLARLDRARVFAVETAACRRYDEAGYRDGDGFLFGRETSGLPQDIVAAWPDEQRVRLPMMPGNRSLNLANAVAVVVYEAWRQLRFPGS